MIDEKKRHLSPKKQNKTKEDTSMNTWDVEFNKG